MGNVLFNSDDVIVEARNIMISGFPEGTIQLVAAYVALYGAPPPGTPYDAIEARVRALAEAHDL